MLISDQNNYDNQQQQSYAISNLSINKPVKFNVLWQIIQLIQLYVRLQTHTATLYQMQFGTVKIHLVVVKDKISSKNKFVVH